MCNQTDRPNRKLNPRTRPTRRTAPASRPVTDDLRARRRNINDRGPRCPSTFATPCAHHARSTSNVTPSSTKACPHLTEAAHAYDLRGFSFFFSQGGPRRNRGWPGHRHPETATPQARNRERTRAQTRPRRSLHSDPKRSLHTPRRRKLSPAHAPNLAPIDQLYLNSCPVYTHHPTITQPLDQTQTIHVPSFRTPRSPRNLTGRLQNYRIRRFHRGLAFKATPAYPDLRGHSGQSSPIITPKAALAHHHPGCHPGLSSPASTALSEPSRDAFEPYRDQARRDGITPSRHHTTPKGPPASTPQRPGPGSCSMQNTKSISNEPKIFCSASEQTERTEAGQNRRSLQSAAQYVHESQAAALCLPV